MPARRRPAYDFRNFEEVKAGLEGWLIEFIKEGPRSSLGDLITAEVIAEALTHRKIAAGGPTVQGDYAIDSEPLSSRSGPLTVVQVSPNLKP